MSEKTLININNLEGSQLCYKFAQATGRTAMNVSFEEFKNNSSPASFPTFLWEIFGPIWDKAPATIEVLPDSMFKVTYQGRFAISSDVKVSYCRAVVSAVFGDSIEV